VIVLIVNLTPVNTEALWWEVDTKCSQHEAARGHHGRLHKATLFTIGVRDLIAMHAPTMRPTLDA
jgi:hypothetical protein